MYTCAHCAVKACRVRETEKKLPTNCPMVVHPEMTGTVQPEYFDEKDRELYVHASEIEAIGYGNWPRIREIVELCLMMGWKKIGLAFCGGLAEEGRRAADIFRKNGLEVVSVMCKTGHCEKEQVGIPVEHRLRKSLDSWESMCNPVMQAKLLNEQKVDFAVVCGLCVGHDTLFYKYIEAPVTTLITKDRLLGHNPVQALYISGMYMDRRVYRDKDPDAPQYPPKEEK